MTMTIIAAAVWAIALAGAGGLMTTVGPWYRGLRKPAWQPPDWAFGPAWTLILGLAAASGVLAWRSTASTTEVMVYFGAISFFHVLWSPLFFLWRRPDWSMVEIGFLWITLAGSMAGLYPHNPLACWLLAPFILWVTFAARLNFEIVRLNAPFTTVAQPAP